MATCPTPSTTTTTYPRSKPMDTSCDLLAEWRDCGTCGGDFDGYDKNDAPVTICVNGVMMIGQSLTDEPNKDNPLTGAFSVVPPTWTLYTLPTWMATKQDKLTGSDGEALPGGTCVPTCAELDAVKDGKQDALTGSDGLPVPAGTCVPTCAELDAVGDAADAAAQAAADAQNTADNAANGLQPQLNSCAGTPHAAGTQVPSCAEMNQAISDAAPTIPDALVFDTDDFDGTGTAGDPITLAGGGGGGGLTTVTTDATLTGDGTAANPLSVAAAGVTALSGCMERSVDLCNVQSLADAVNTILYASCHQTATGTCNGGGDQSVAGPSTDYVARIL